MVLDVHITPHPKVVQILNATVNVGEPCLDISAEMLSISHHVGSTNFHAAE
jgi:hypothetical protein